MSSNRVAGSFRDPSGFLFRRAGTLYRQVNESYQDDYDRLLASGLYDELVEENLLVAHKEVEAEPYAPGAYRIIRPTSLPFVSYPYEWCFGQLRDAALATLEIQERALKAGLSLKDASAYNVQFRASEPVFIDSLSFEKYREGQPWVAYAQFCQHFLAPLALMSYTDVRLSKLLRAHIDGVPLDLASTLLPMRTRLRFSLLAHIHFHARGQERYAEATSKAQHRSVGRTELLGIVDNLKTAVRKLSWHPAGTEWADYYEDTNYTDRSREAKEVFVSEALQTDQPDIVWDVGANTGRFSEIAEDEAYVLAFDVDVAAVEKNYRRQCQKDTTSRILPLTIDLANPSPALGWAHTERMSFEERGPADTILALALVHHLVISNNLPLGHISAFFARLCRTLVVEFVPKQDEQTQRLLVTREDIFSDYSRNAFEEAFGADFSIAREQEVSESGRVLYHMRNRDPSPS